MKNATTLLLAMMGLTAAACGRTELEWEQKVREVEALSNRVAKQNLERATLDEERARAVEENNALKAELAARGNTSQVATQACAEQSRAERQTIDQLRARADVLRIRLESLASDGLTVSLRKGLLTISMPATMIFEGKNADLSPLGRKTLRSIAEAVLADDRLLARFFLVTAHEIPGKKEEGAIGRSLTRAQAVHNLLTGRQGGLPPARWSAAGRGVVDPVVGDDQPEQSGRNQRVEIVMLPDASELLSSSRAQ